MKIFFILMKAPKEIEIFEEMKEKDENLIEHKRSKKKNKSIFKRIFIFIYISSLILTTIFNIIRTKTAFIIFLSISIIFSACLLVRLIIIGIKNRKKERERLLKEEEEKKKKEEEEKRRKKEEEERRKEEEKQKKKEEEEREKKKKEIIERQFLKKLNNGENRKENVKEVLEDMCILGSIMKKEILEEKKTIQKNLYQ